MIAELVDGVIERGGFDLVEDIAVDFPLTVTADTLGVPREDRRKRFEGTNTFARLMAAGNETTRNSLAGGLLASRSIPISGRR